MLQRQVADDHEVVDALLRQRAGSLLFRHLINFFYVVAFHPLKSFPTCFHVGIDSGDLCTSSVIILTIITIELKI